MSEEESSEEEVSIPEIQDNCEAMPDDLTPQSNEKEDFRSITLSNGRTVDISLLVEGLPLNAERERDEVWSRDFLFDQVRKLL